MMCSYGPCTAPDTICPHWQGTFCDLDDWSSTTIHIDGIEGDYAVTDNLR